MRSLAANRSLLLWIVVILAAASAPLVLTEIELFTAAKVVILALWAASLNLLVGQTGLVSFAHAAYYGIGAYTVALVWLHLEWSPLLGIPLAVPVGAILALVTGLFALRAVRLYFALLTLALSQLVYVIVFQWYSFTQGDNGIHGIEMPEFLDSTGNAYWFILGVTVVAMIGLAVIARSPFGAALVAIRENRQRAAFVGINVKRYELAAFTIAGTFAAIAGALFAVFNREAYPNLLFWTESSIPIFIILIGGMFRFWGPLIGAVAFGVLEETIAGQTEYSHFIFGAVLLAIVLLIPGGIEGLGESIYGRFRSSRRARGESGPEAAT